MLHIFLQQNVDYSHPSNFYSSLLPTRVNAAASPSSVLGHTESCEQNHSSNGSNNATPIPSTSSSSNNQMSFSSSSSSNNTHNSHNNNSGTRNASPIVYGGGGGSGESVNEHYKTRIGGHGIFKPIAKNASFNSTTTRSMGGRDNCKNIHNDSHDDRPSPGDSIVSAGGEKDDQEECMSRERTLSPSDSSVHSNSPSPDLPAISTATSSTTTAAAAAAAAAASLSSAIPVPPFPASHLLEFYSQYFNGSFKAADSLHSLAAARETGL